MIHQTMRLVEESFCTLHAILSFYLTILFISHSLHRFFVNTIRVCCSSVFFLLSFCSSEFVGIWSLYLAILSISRNSEFVAIEFVSRSSVYFSKFFLFVVILSWLQFRVCISIFWVFFVVTILRLLQFCIYFGILHLYLIFIAIWSSYLTILHSFCNSEFISRNSANFWQLTAFSELWSDKKRHSKCNCNMSTKWN